MAPFMDRAITVLQRQLNTASSITLRLTMHFPTAWDPYFAPTMSVFRRLPLRHPALRPSPPPAHPLAAACSQRYVTLLAPALIRSELPPSRGATVKPGNWACVLTRMQTVAKMMRGVARGSIEIAGIKATR